MKDSMKTQFYSEKNRYSLLLILFLLVACVFSQERKSTLIQQYKVIKGQVPVHPYFPVTSNSGTVTNAQTLVSTYTEAQWLNFVPLQAPRSLQKSPADVNNTTWVWSPTTPDQITCSTTGIVFPNAAYTTLYADVTVMTGKTIKVPYINTSKGMTFIQAQIDYQKMAFLSSNLDMLSAAYQLTGNETYARYVALALDKLASIVPDYFMTKAWNIDTLVNLNELNTYRSTITFVQRASDHNGIAHELDDNCILAFDRIYDSNALKTLSTEKGYDVNKHIMNDFFLNITLWLVNQPTMESHLGTNLPGYIEDMIKVATICPDTTTSGLIMKFVDKYFGILLARNFKRDGMYPESFSYHTGYAQDSYTSIQLIDQYYSMFPPTNSSSDSISTRTAYRLAFTKRCSLVQDSVAFPNGDMAPFDDTRAGTSVVRNQTQSYLLPAYSHGMLGDGTGIQQIQSNIGANDKANHVGNSMMSMTLFAFGNEQIGDIRYSRIPGREFTNAVQAHNLVAVDEDSSQYFSAARQVYGNVGHVFTNGYFTLFEPHLDGVAATEVYSNTINPGKVTRYQRLQVLNTIDLSTPYLVDVFVVAGGTTHDYILNGSTQIDQTAVSSLPLVPINKTYPLLPAGATYKDPVLELDNTNWYGAFRNESSSTSNGNWNVSFQQNNTTAGVKIFALDDATPTVYLGTSPYPYRRVVESSLYAYWRPALLERRVGTSSNTKSVFVHVIEAFNNGSAIQSVTPMPLSSPSNEYVAFSVLFKNGRKDDILLNLNHELITNTAATAVIQSADKTYSLTGKMGVFSTQNSVTKGYLIHGSNLTYKADKLDVSSSVYSGTITGVARTAEGAPYNAFITNAVLPEGNELNGKWISVRYGVYSVISPPSTITTQSNMNELFKISGVKIIGGKTYILCAEDPQLNVSGNVTTELLRPQRVFNGPTTFKIEKSATTTFNPTAINDAYIETPISVFPDPASNEVMIQSEKGIDNVSVINLSGQSMKYFNDILGAHQKQILTQDFPSGLYFCKVNFEDKTSGISRFIVMH